MGIFNQRFEALFPRTRALGYTVCLAPCRLYGPSVCECGAAGCYRCSACPVLCHSESGPLGLSVRECRAAGSASGQTACPIHPTLHQSRSHHSHASPLRPGARLRPSYRSECMFLFYLLGVGLPCRWIFYQFWLCEEAQCVYLHRHLGSPKHTLFKRSHPFSTSPHNMMPNNYFSDILSLYYHSPALQ